MIFLSYTNNSHSKLFHIGSGRYEIRICPDWDEAVGQVLAERANLLDRLEHT